MPEVSGSNMTNVKMFKKYEYFCTTPLLVNLNKDFKVLCYNKKKICISSNTLELIIFCVMQTFINCYPY